MLKTEDIKGGLTLNLCFKRSIIPILTISHFFLLLFYYLTSLIYLSNMHSETKNEKN